MDSGRCDFRGWHFPGKTEFLRRSFQGAAFNHVAFHDEVKFIESTFDGHTSFRDTRFLKRVDFWNCEFHRVCWFEGAMFRDIASFQEVTFAEAAWFIGAVFKGGLAVLNCVFRRYADFSGASFLESARFYSNNYDGELILDDVAFARRIDECFAYEQGYLNALKHLRWDRARRYFYQFRHAYLRTLSKWAPKRWLLWLWEKIAGHGQQPESVLLTMALTILGFALLCWITQAVDPAVEGPPPTEMASFWDSLYFSAVTFSTLGSIGLGLAGSPIGRWIAPIESIVGAILIALFVVTLTRKLTW